MPDRAYLSIGEVLGLLKAEFDDITISKIRFLESQGLLDPERTPSGYRKFYEVDVERLRWILRQQRENFLPLKVIKGRLGVDTDDEPATADGARGVAAASSPVKPPIKAPATRPEPPVRPGRRPVADEPPPVLGLGPTSASFTKAELSQATGLSHSEIDELERYGLLTGRTVGGTLYFDEEAAVVARAAAGFRAFGVEARHLRMFKNAAEREAGFLEQVITPLLKQRNPAARIQATDTVKELSKLGQTLRSSLLRQALRDATGG